MHVCYAHDKILSDWFEINYTKTDCMSLVPNLIETFRPHTHIHSFMTY